MISLAEYIALVDELLSIEKELKILGNKEIITSEGLKYALFEMAFTDKHPEQQAYNLLRRKFLEKKKIVEAFDMVARYKLAIGELEGK